VKIRSIRVKSILVVTLLFLLLFVFTLTCLAESTSSKQEDSASQSKTRVLSITGSADVMVIPDEAIFNLAVETTNMKIMDAKAENDISIKKIRAITKELKIEDEDVKTDYISVTPKYTYTSNGENIFNGYIIHRGLIITLKDLTKFDELFTRILDAGANYVQNVQFTTTHLREHKDEARALAIKAAKEKAVALAKELGQTIGKANMIQEMQEDTYYYSPWSSGGYMGANSVSNVNAASNSIANASGVSSQNTDIDGNAFSPGQIKVSARISVTFDLN
jgi:uncharacterized protein